MERQGSSAVNVPACPAGTTPTCCDVLVSGIFFFFFLLYKVSIDLFLQTCETFYVSIEAQLIGTYVLVSQAASDPEAGGQDWITCGPPGT